MALPADIAYKADPGRNGAVVAVTFVAGGRGKVALVRHGLPVDGGLVLRHLVRRNLVAGHVLGVTVTAAAGVRHVERVDAGLGVRGWPDIVSGMAARARGDLGIPELAQPAPVD